MKGRVLVASRDATTNRQLSAELAKMGCEVITATSTAEAMHNLYHQALDMAIIDTEAEASLDGWELCLCIRDFSQMPLILLIASGREEDKLKGLRLGADDFLVKPFSMRELLLRAQVQLRRISAEKPGLESSFYANGYLWASFSSCEVCLEGQTVHLTPREHRLLLHLIRNAGRVLSQEDLLNAVWGEDKRASASTLKQYILRLRQKLEKDPGNPRLIVTSYGKGYFFNAPLPPPANGGSPLPPPVNGGS
ncbi:MAG: response regulator transcription factor, partial [Anaerolineae bacterium]